MKTDRELLGIQPVAYADEKALKNLRIDGHKGTPYNREWMWAKPDAGLVPLYTATQSGEFVTLVAALRSIADMTYDEWTNGAEAGRIAREALRIVDRAAAAIGEAME